MLKKLSLLALSLALSFTALQAKEDKEIETAEIGDTAVQLSSLRIFKGQHSEKLFNASTYTVIVFWEFSPTYAKASRKKLTKEEKQEAKEKLEESYAAHEAIFKIKQTLASQKQGSRVRVVAINNESPEATQKYLQDMEAYFKKRANKKDGKITVPILDNKTQKLKDEVRTWSCNYALGYDAPKKVTKIPKGENPVLRGKIWEDYMVRFGYDETPMAFIIGKPSDEEAKAYAKEQKEKGKSKKTTYPELENSRVLWIGAPDQVADEIQAIFEKQQENKSSRKRKSR